MNAGFVFQGFNLLPDLTAVENVMLPMEFTPRPRHEAEERARTLLLQADHEPGAEGPG